MTTREEQLCVLEEVSPLPPNGGIDPICSYRYSMKYRLSPATVFPKKWP